MLKERDTVHQDKEWVLKEALSGRKLQIGGTFQNVLERRLDEVIVPIFAAILSFTDHYSNLDLIKPRYINMSIHSLFYYIIVVILDKKRSIQYNSCGIKCSLMINYVNLVMRVCQLARE